MLGVQADTYRYTLLQCWSRQLMHWDTFKQDNYSTVGGDGGCRVGEVRAGTTFLLKSLMAEWLEQASQRHEILLS